MPKPTGTKEQVTGPSRSTYPTSLLQGLAPVAPICGPLHCLHAVSASSHVQDSCLSRGPQLLAGGNSVLNVLPFPSLPRASRTN